MTEISLIEIRRIVKIYNDELNRICVNGSLSMWHINKLKEELQARFLVHNIVVK